MLQRRFKDCSLDFNTINLENQTIELIYFGNLSIQQLFDTLKQWESTFTSGAWSINLIEID
jgi:hypothetical protein